VKSSTELVTIFSNIKTKNMEQFKFDEMGLIELNEKELQQIDGGCIWLLVSLIVVFVALVAEAYYDVL
jgi:bacteriocin-like protein